MNSAQIQSDARQQTRIAWVVYHLSAGGIGPVCTYAARGIASTTSCKATVVSLSDTGSGTIEGAPNIRIIGFGSTKDIGNAFLQWLEEQPQDIVITSDVSTIEPTFPYLPRRTLHVIQIHDSLRRYQDVAVRNQGWIDGVCCVAQHIEKSLRPLLNSVGYRGVLSTVHNGAIFPPPHPCQASTGPFRLLFTGRLDPFKGVLDLIPLLKRLEKLKVPTQLTIAGDRDPALEARFDRKGLGQSVTWVGRVPHKECFNLAAQHDLFLMLSRKEPFGMVTIEAMSMGCVPLAYDTPSGSTEIIQHGKNGLLIPLGDYDSMAWEIKLLNDNRERWRVLSSGAIFRARSEFGAHALGRRLASFLGQVQANAGVRPSERKSGVPDKLMVCGRRSIISYQRLPLRLRKWVRNMVGTSPRLAYWAATKWSQ